MADPDPPPGPTPVPDPVRDTAPDPEFDRTTARLLRREALRRAAQELNTTSGPGLEDMLARISAEVTAEAIERTDAHPPHGTGRKS